MELTREQAIIEHRKMWNWIADETERRKCVVNKREYIRSKRSHDEGVLLFDCYCCEYSHGYAYQRRDSTRAYCKYCPIDWPSRAELWKCEHSQFNDEKGLYRLWITAYNKRSYRQAATIARQIATLPERTDNIPNETK